MPPPFRRWLFTRAWELPATAYYRSADEPAGAAFIPTYEQLVAATRREADDYLAAKAAELRNRGVAKLRTATLQGDAADKILELAGQTPDCLIALCTHGRSGLTRWVLGSVTEKIVQQSRSPMLIIRAR
ncbi:MAG: universal stress protein [Deltaproteobacteria bacterium]|nr:universal stress protein [Deltaproteobacteria bacterium]